MSRLARRVLSVLALGAVLVAGSGCGVSRNGFQPGVAADVDGDRVYTGEVDDTANDVCDYFTERGGGQAFPKADLRSEVLRLVVRQIALEKVLDESGLELRAAQPDAVQDFLGQYFPDAAERFQGGLTQIAEGSIEVQNGLVDLGTQALQDDGQQVDPTQQDALIGRGLEVLGQWVQDHDVDLNPLYGLAVDDDGQISNESTDTSVVVSDEARFGVAPEAGKSPSADQQKYVDSLPASQTCG